MGALRRNTAILLAGLSFALFGLLYWHEPTDHDAGPMMAYNLLFAFPLLLLAGLLAGMALLTAVQAFRNTPQGGIFRLLSCVLLASPAFLGAASFVLRIVPLAGSRNETAPVARAEEIYANTESVALASGQTIYLVGFKWGPHYHNRRVYLSNRVPSVGNVPPEGRIFGQGGPGYTFRYERVYDSLRVYLPANDVLYHYMGKEPSLPVRATPLPPSLPDSAKPSARHQTVQTFRWTR